ncbi:hypothetical protein ACB098_02G073100 [Castanea mollissima]
MGLSLHCSLPPLPKTRRCHSQNLPPSTPSSFARPLTPLLTTISSLSPSPHNPSCRRRCHPSLSPSLPSSSLLCRLPLPSPNFDIYAKLTTVHGPLTLEKRSAEYGA